MVAGNPKKMPNPLQGKTRVPGPFGFAGSVGPMQTHLAVPGPFGFAGSVAPDINGSGISALTNQINSIRSNWAANAPAMPQQPQPTGEGLAFFAQPNFRFPSQTAMPSQQRPMDRQQLLSQQASAIQAGNAAVAAGRAWKLDGGGGQMPTYLPRNPIEQVRAQFMQTYVFGAKDKALSRNFGPQKMGYIDDKGQMTGTNRLGMLRRLAASDPNDEQIKNALAGAEEVNRQNMEARRAKIPEYQAKAAARNDAKRARAGRQADAMRARMGIGPRTSGKETPANPITAAAGPHTIENQVAAAGRIAERAATPHFLGADMSQSFGDLNDKARSRLKEDPNATFSDESLRAWQQQAADYAQLATPENDPFHLGYGLDQMNASDQWRELARLPDNARARKDWFDKFKNTQQFGPTRVAPPFGQGFGY